MTSNQQTKVGKEQTGSKQSKSKPSYKHIPHSQKPPHLVAKRNARERRRVQAVNQAFYKLRKCVPIENRNKRVSKVKTLQRAIDYIRKMERILEEHDGQDSQVILGAHSQQLNGNSSSFPQAPELLIKPTITINTTTKTKGGCDSSSAEPPVKQRRGRKPANSTPTSGQSHPNQNQSQKPVGEQFSAASESQTPGNLDNYYPSAASSYTNPHAQLPAGSAPTSALYSNHYYSPQHADQGYGQFGHQDGFESNYNATGYSTASLYQQQGYQYGQPEQWADSAGSQALALLQSPTSSSTNSSLDSAGGSSALAAAQPSTVVCRAAFAPETKQQVNGYLAYASANNVRGATHLSFAVNQQQQYQQPIEQQSNGPLSKPTDCGLDNTITDNGAHHRAGPFGTSTLQQQQQQQQLYHHQHQLEQQHQQPSAFQGNHILGHQLSTSQAQSI